MMRSATVPKPASTSIEFTGETPTRDGHRNECRVYRPHDPSSSSAAAGGSSPTGLAVLVHGGGFVLGGNTDLAVSARAIARLYGITVVCLSYRLAPEHKFPTGPNDVIDALEWLTKPEAARDLGLNLDLAQGFYVGGPSAGANLAAVAAQQWAAEGRSPRLRGVWLGIPLILSEETVPAKYKHLWLSREQNAKALIINAGDIEYVNRAYAQEPTSLLFSPLAPGCIHEAMPPVYFQVCGQDPLRDDGLIYEKVLRDHGVSTRLDVYPGLPHGFDLMFPSFALSRKYAVDVLQGFGWLLGKDVSAAACEEALNATAVAA
jgi:acetyl esterase/lipase